MLNINNFLKANYLLILMGFIGNMDFCMPSSEEKESCSTQLSHLKHKGVMCLRVKEGKNLIISDTSCGPMIRNL